MNNKFNKDAVRYSLLLHDADMRDLINELAEKKGNRNTVLNVALQIGVPMLYAREFGKEQPGSSEPASAPAIGRELKEIRKIQSEMFVEISILEPLLAGLYNVKIDELDGKTVNSKRLLDGSIGELPELVAKYKQELERNTTRRGNGE